MRKVIVAFEVPHFSTGAMRFVNEMNHAEHVALTGVFLPKPVFTAFQTVDTMTPGMFLPFTEELNPSELNKCVQKFEQYSTEHHLKHRVLSNITGFGLPELKQQTRYADLMIVGSESFFNLPGSDKLSEYLKTSFHDAECPVVAAPENFVTPENNIITFDGSESSARAIKSFAYLFPEMTENPTTILTFGSKNTTDKENDKRIKELVSVHFPNHKFIHYGFDSNRYFSSWSIDKKPAIVVCGAFGRSMLSVLFRHSFITDVLKSKKLPVFISHK